MVRARRGGLFILIFILALSGLPALARPPRAAAAASISAYDLIAGVNALRAARGLSQLKIHPSLMASAQAHTDFQAAMGSLSHTGPGGSRPIDRARAAGYGGGAWIAIAENIAIFPEDSPNIVSSAIYQAWTDDLHLNTMLNTGLQHAGAGVTVSNGMVYLTLDTGWIAGLPLVSDTPTVSGTPPTRTPVTLVPYVRLVTSTPMPDGSVYHVVGYGQVLVNIAAAYGVKLNDLAALNRITPDKIYDGQKLLIHPSATPVPPGQAAAPRPTQAPTQAPNSLGARSPGDSLEFASPVPGSSPAAPQGGAGATLVHTPGLAAIPSPSATASPPVQPQPAAPPPLSPNQVGILVTVAGGVLAIILVSIRKKS